MSPEIRRTLQQGQTLEIPPEDRSQELDANDNPISNDSSNGGVSETTEDSIMPHLKPNTSHYKIQTRSKTPREMRLRSGKIIPPPD